MTKLFFFDLETTGVQFWKNGIHQISGAIGIDGELKERFNFHVRPHEKAQIDSEALLVGNVTREQIQAYPPMQEVYKELTTLLAKYVDKFNKQDKFHLVGYNNASFDNPFLRAFFVQNNDKYFGSWFWSDSLDVMVLASNFLKGQRSEMENFKQSTVAKFLGIEIDEARLHEAGYDIDVCFEIFKLVSQIK
jgi:DNA polymerase III subunit epsilon